MSTKSEISHTHKHSETLLSVVHSRSANAASRLLLRSQAERKEAARKMLRHLSHLNARKYNAETSMTCMKQEERTGIWSVVWLGLAPLVLLASTGVAIMVLVALIRHLIGPTSFLLQQQLFLVVMTTGLAVAVIGYTVAITRALKRIATWRRNGYTTKATAGLAVVTSVAIIVVLPVILALFFH